MIQRATARKNDQCHMARQRRYGRARSVRTKIMNTTSAVKVSFHTILTRVTSGQLLLQAHICFFITLIIFLCNPVAAECNGFLQVLVSFVGVNVCPSGPPNANP